MKNILITFILLALGLAAPAAAGAQDFFPQLKREKPDLGQIKKDILTSEFYYPHLMAEHLGNDTTMKVEKYRRLYLGYMLQEDYNPYREHPLPASVAPLYGKVGKMTRAEADTIIKYAQEVLADNPFDLYQMIALTEAYRVKGKTNLAKIWNTKLKYILMAILSTGTGRDRENAWWVVSPQHEYILLQFLGYRPTNHTFYSPDYEMLTATPPGGGADGRFYFNIRGILDEYYRKYE